MNRQKRLEAIARRRAFIDSQIQMLSSTEVRLPNIIRNRTGRPLPARPKCFQAVEYVESTGNVFSSSSHYKQTASEITLNNNNAQLPQQGFKIDQPSSTEEVYVALVNGEDGEQGQMTLKIEGAVDQHATLDGGVPITLSEEIAKMLASATGTTEQLIKTLKTIQTEDGTVMVVLEGNNFTESEAEVADGNTTTPVGEEEQSEAFMCPTPEPVAENEVRNDEEIRTEFEESYVIVQTPEGDVLVPSSKICSQFQAPPPVSSEESIMQFIATESGAIENLITSKNSSDLTNKKRPAVNNKRVNHNVLPPKQNKPTPKINSATLGTGAIKRPIVKNVSAFNRSKDSSSHPKKVLKKKSSIVGHKLVNNVCNRVQSNVYAPNGSPVTPSRSVNAQEKPRPFRFELPELEDRVNDLDDCFMTVPVPIKIDSLRSETEKGNNIAKETKSDLSLFQFSVTTTLKKSNSSSMENPVKNGVEPSSQNTLNNTSPGQIEELSQVLKPVETQIATSVITCQQCNQQFSSEFNLLNHKQNGSCNSFLQCLQCFSIFSTESSFSNHLGDCATTANSQQSNMDENVSSVSMDAERELSLDSGSAEENLVIKSVNSLSTPMMSIPGPPAEVAEETKLVISSPLDSNENVDSSIHLSSSPVVFLSSSDFISKNENLVSFCVQLVEDESNNEDSKSEKLSNNNYVDSLENVPSGVVINGSEQHIVIHSSEASNSIDNNDNILNISGSTEAVLVEEAKLSDGIMDVGRRTLNKASAKANMNFEMGDGEAWSSSSDGIVASNHSENNGNSGSIQSARIRSRNDRIKAMDKNKTNEEELGFNFRSIFEQVVKQGIPFN